MKELSIDDIFYQIDKFSNSNNTIIITDSNVYNLYLKDKKYKIIVFKPGEDNKNLNTIEYIYSKLEEYNTDRHSILIGFGGGIVTDVVGYVASTYMRGLKFYFVSTTLLGMIDASIGGKNGVNYKNYKNLIGTFNTAEDIYYSLEFLNTLPGEEIHAGVGEILKYAIGFDKELFDLLNNTNYEDLISNDFILSKVINKCISIKEDIVKEDFEENNLRKKLNLGHTIAHAIEKSTHSFVHGEAVGIGLFVMTYYSAYLNKIDYNTLIDIISLIEKYHFTLPIPEYKNVLTCIKYINNDKKSNNQDIDLILIKGIGSCEIESKNKNEFIEKIKSIFLVS